jgi:Tol biopolymer transport system component
MRKNLLFHICLVGILVSFSGCALQPELSFGRTQKPNSTVPSEVPLSPSPTILRSTQPSLDVEVTLPPSFTLAEDEHDFIAFKSFSEEENAVTIFLVHPDNPVLKGLVTLPGHLLGRDYSWSPDGKHIAFSQTTHVENISPDFFQIFTIAISSGEINQLTNSDEHNRKPVWSPDGSMIAFFSGEDYLLSTVSIYDNNIRLLSKETRISTDISWSPGATQIACAIGSPPYDFSIWFIDVNSGNKRQFETEFLIQDTEYQYAADPIWTPDGNHLVFLKQHDLYYGDIDGESSTRLTFTLDYPELWFDLSPDGSMVAFLNYDETYVYLTIIDLQGNVITQEKLGVSFEVNFDWSPDNRTVVLTMENQLWVYSLIDQSLYKLLDCPGKCQDPQWQP